MALPADFDPEWWQEYDDWSLARAYWELLTKYDWKHPWRAKQIVPPGDWFIALFLAGRGWGKTRVGAEDVSEYARTHPDTRYALVCETFADGRDVMVEGESGILSVVPPSCVADWNRSMGELIFINGARAKIFTSEKPDKLRGPQHHRAWVDEPAKLRHPMDTWDNLMFGLRLGDRPQVIVTGTPKPTELLFMLDERPDVVKITGSTFENEHNLAPQFIAELRLKYEGTRLGRQEMYAELLRDFEGALWRREWIDLGRVPGDQLEEILKRCTRGVVSIDPSTWDPEMGDNPNTIAHGYETGIVAAVIDDQRSPSHVYIVRDASMRGSTQREWALKAIETYHWLGQYVPVQMVFERNLGAGSGHQTIRQIDDSVRFFRDEHGKIGVWAAHAKRARAEPVSSLYEPGAQRVHHVGFLPELEGQLCGWDPTENWSPDRLDACVWAVTSLKPWTLASGTGVGALLNA